MSATDSRGASRIERAIRRAQSDKARGAFVPFLTAGYPDADAMCEVALALVEAGADVLEIGIPFSDPLADGPVIQRSSQAALAAGVTPQSSLDLVARITERTTVPVVLMTYLNPIMQLAGGLDHAVRRSRFAGVILTDLPFDQDHEIWDAVEASGIDAVLLVTPTTPLERARQIVARAGGFVYCVTRLGVTGQGETAEPELEARIMALREMSHLPLLLGFGIGSAADARRLGGLADGVVVGSALIERLDGAPDPVRAARELAREIVTGLEEVRAG